MTNFAELLKSEPQAEQLSQMIRDYLQSLPEYARKAFWQDCTSGFCPHCFGLAPCHCMNDE